jgi:hypothetical protein
MLQEIATFFLLSNRKRFHKYYWHLSVDSAKIKEYIIGVKWLAL